MLFEVLMTVTTQRTLLWEMTSCSHVLSNSLQEVPAFIIEIKEYTAFCLHYRRLPRGTEVKFLPKTSFFVFTSFMFISLYLVFLWSLGVRYILILFITT
jgi:hypothetical protein